MQIGKAVVTRRSVSERMRQINMKYINKTGENNLHSNAKSVFIEDLSSCFFKDPSLSFWCAINSLLKIIKFSKGFNTKCVLHSSFLHFSGCCEIIPFLQQKLSRYDNTSPRNSNHDFANFRTVLSSPKIFKSFAQLSTGTRKTSTSSHSQLE